MTAMLRYAALLLALPLYAAAQTAPAPGTFYDVATIKPYDGLSGDVYENQNRDRYDAKNVSVLSLLEDAYTIKRELIFGVPGDVAKPRYDVLAKISEPDNAALSHQTREQIAARMQPLLAERFHLKAHYETRELPVFELAVAKGGAKIAPDAPGAAGGEGVSQHNSALEVHGITLARLGEVIMPYAGRPVVDKTALTGRFSFKLHWANEHDATDDGPTIFTAVEEQLGLKLRPAKGPVQVLVVDHVEAPTQD